MYNRTRVKKEYKCSVCDKVYLRWQGICSSCKKAGTIEEKKTIVQASRATNEQKALARRAKKSERTIAKRMLDADGPDPIFQKIATSTGRIGHITGIRIDAISKTYVTENKNRKMPTWLIAAWILINQRGTDFDKNVLLHIEPPNMPREFVVNGEKHKLGTMAIITQERHEALIHHEKALASVLEILQSEIPDKEKMDSVINYLVESDHLKK